MTAGATGAAPGAGVPGNGADVPGNGAEASGDPVVVVGGGISGVACAAQVARAGLPVLLLDRGQHLGGRMAAPLLQGTGTRWDGRPVDVGASYLTAHDPAFRAVVDDWIDRGLARGWTDTFHVAGREGLRGTTTGPLRYAAPRGLRSLVEDLAANLPGDLVTVLHPVEADLVTRGPDGRPVVAGRPARAAALCMPDPQARRLLDPAVGEFLPTRQATEGVLWEPVLVLTAVFARRCWPDDIDGIFVNDDRLLTWVADDGRRRGDDAPVLVAHADTEPSAAHLGAPDALLPALVDALVRVIGGTEQPVWARVRRWSYARPVTAWPDPYHFDPDTGLGLAGDGWHAGPRVECAWLSGAALGRALAARLTGRTTDPAVTLG